MATLQWRHYERDDVSNHQRPDCLLNCLLRRRKKSNVRVTGLCEGKSPLIGELPTQRTSNAEKFSIWWRHHDPLQWCWPSNIKSTVCWKKLIFAILLNFSRRLFQSRWLSTYRLEAFGTSAPPPWAWRFTNAAIVQADIAFRMAKKSFPKLAAYWPRWQTRIRSSLIRLLLYSTIKFPGWYNKMNKFFLQIKVLGLTTKYCEMV